MTIINKIKWILGVLLVFLLIVTTNLIDRNNFKQVKNSIETIYEDRLVAKGILYNLSDLLHEKEIAYVGQDTSFFRRNNRAINSAMDELILIFSDTRLIAQEKKTLDKLLINFNQLKEMENNFELVPYDGTQPWSIQLNKVKGYLDELSKIQIKEAEKQLSFGKKAMDAIELYTKIEIYLLVFLALVIQFLIIYSSPKKSNDKAEN